MTHCLDELHGAELFGFNGEDGYIEKDWLMAKKVLYRNWKGICEVENYGLRMELSFVDLGSDRAKQLARSHRDCFQNVEDGPVELSSIAQEEMTICLGVEGFQPGYLMVTNGAHKKFNIPIFTWATSKDAAKKCGVVHLHVMCLGKIGEVVKIQGKQFVILEFDTENSLVECAPKERILVDC